MILDRDYHMTTKKAHAAAAEVLPSLGVSFCHMTPQRYCPAVFLVGGLLFGLFFFLILFTVSSNRGCS